MAEISVERKPRNLLPLILGILLLAVVAFLVWRYMGGSAGADTSSPPAVTDTTAR